MALNKINYINNETIITAENLNEIQDSVISLENFAELNEVTRANIIAALGYTPPELDFFKKGKSLQSTDNLNDFDKSDKIGKYTALNGTVAEALAATGNSPTNANFVLYVIQRTDSPITQLIIDLQGRLFIRSKSTKNWNEWKKYLAQTSLANNYTTTAEGYAADARIVKSLYDELNGGRIYSGQASTQNLNIVASALKSGNTASGAILFMIDSNNGNTINVGVIKMQNMATQYFQILGENKTITDNEKYNITIPIGQYNRYLIISDNYLTITDV